MSIGTMGKRSARLAAVLVAVILPACGTGATGGSSNSGLLWNSQAGSGLTATGSQPVTWINPNTGLGGGTIGIIQVIESVDDATYARFNVSTQPPPLNDFIAYIYALEHPLSTDTGSITITSFESELLGHLNGYRNMVMGNQIGALNGGFLVGGGSVVLPSVNKGTKCARAHCKHYAYFHGAGPMPGEGVWNFHHAQPANNLIEGGPWILRGLTGSAAPPTNAEGDHVIFTRAGTPADQTSNPGIITPLRPGMLPKNPLANQGRLGKIMVDTAPFVGEFSYSGLQYDQPITVRDQIVSDDGALVVDFFPSPPYPGWSHICVGHWRGGANSFYWNVLFLKNPNPAN